MKTTHQCGAIFALLLTVLFFHFTKGSLIQKGDLFQSNNFIFGEAKGAFLLRDYKLPKGAVYGFNAYFINKNPIRFLVLRPSSPDSLKYNLVNEISYTPGAEKAAATINLNCGQYILTEENDILGIWHETDTSPLAYQIDAISNVYGFATSNGNSVPNQLEFADVQLPYKFSLKVNIDTEWGLYRSPCGNQQTVAPITFPPPPTKLPLVPIPVTNGTQDYVGHILTEAPNTESGTTRRIYLLESISFTQPGVIRAFYAYFSTGSPIKFLVLRPDSTNPNGYLIAGEKQYDPPESSVPGQIRVPLGNNEIIHAQKGDRLGFMNEDKFTSSIGYRFVKGPQTVVFIAPFQEDLSYIQRGRMLEFDTLPYPYYFAVGAVFDKDLAKYPTEPPMPQITTTPTLVVTTPSTGKQERLLSNGDALTSTELSFFESSAQRIYLLRDMEVLEDGKVLAFFASFKNMDAVRFQIYRKVDIGGSKYMLINEHRFNPNGTQGVKTIPVDIPFSVKKGDLLALLNEGDKGSIGYKLNPERECYYNRVPLKGIFPTIGDTMDIDPLGFPFEFAVGMRYYMNELPTTPAQSTIGPAVGEQRDMPSWLIDERFILALFIWLVIITVLFMVLLIYLIFRKKEEDKRLKRQPSWDKTLARSSSTMYSSWRGNVNLRDDEQIDYFQPTTGVRSTHSSNGMLNGSRTKLTNNNQ